MKAGRKESRNRTRLRTRPGREGKGENEAKQKEKQAGAQLGPAARPQPPNSVPVASQAAHLVDQVGDLVFPPLLPRGLVSFFLESKSKEPEPGETPTRDESLHRGSSGFGFTFRSLGSPAVPLIIYTAHERRLPHPSPLC